MRTPRPCRAWRETLRDLVDGHASVESVAAVERHAKTCAGCNAELEVARRMRGLFDGASEGELTRAGEDSFIESVFAQIDAGAEPQGAAEALPPLRRAPRRVAALSAASLVLAAAAALLLLLRGDAVRPPAPQESPGIAQRADIAAADETAPGDVERAAPALTGADRVLVLGDERAQLDIERFSADLESAVVATGFDAARSADLRALLLELGSVDSADLARGARGVLRGDGPVSLRGAAARLLGPRADARDRSMIRTELDSLGLAAARALLDGGDRGVALLWSAAQRSGEQGAVALDALIAASATGDVDPLDAMPEGTDASSRVASRLRTLRARRASSSIASRPPATRPGSTPGRRATTRRKRWRGRCDATRRGTAPAPGWCAPPRSVRPAPRSRSSWMLSWTAIRTLRTPSQLCSPSEEPRR